MKPHVLPDCAPADTRRPAGGAAASLMSPAGSLRHRPVEGGFLDLVPVSWSRPNFLLEQVLTETPQQP